MAGKGKPFVNGDPRAGRPPGRANNITLEIRQFCRALLNDPEYQSSLKKRLIEGKLGNMEAELWHYAFGPPPTHPLDPLGEMLEKLSWKNSDPIS
jgi:hypothetical protein